MTTSRSSATLTGWPRLRRQLAALSAVAIVSIISWGFAGLMGIGIMLASESTDALVLPLGIVAIPAFGGMIAGVLVGRSLWPRAAPPAGSGQERRED